MDSRLFMLVKELGMPPVRLNIAIESRELSLTPVSIEPIVFKWLGCNTNTCCKDKDHSQDGLLT
jgi:hypothetical protein